MAVTRCISSHLMSNLLTWRNQQTDEGSGNPQIIENLWKHIGKIVTAEIGLCILTTTSIVETVAYTTFLSLSLPLLTVTDRPYEFFAKHLESSTFTIIWAIADLLFYNPIYINVITRESFARYEADRFNPTPINFFRTDDSLDIGERNPGVIEIPPTTQELTDQGAELIVREVLSGSDDNTLRLFKEVDSSIFMFILTKAIYIYAAGPKKNDPIPRFFKQETKTALLNLRKTLKNEEVLRQLQTLMTNSAEFENEPQNETARSAFNQLKSAASGELQGSFFMLKCWKRATEMLPE